MAEMHHEVTELADAAALAAGAAAFVARAAREAVAARGRFTFAVSGGSTPWAMFAELVREDVPWADVVLFQVDERVAPAGDADRNLTHLRESLLTRIPLRPEQVHANASASGIELSPDVLAAIDQALGSVPVTGPKQVPGQEPGIKHR